MAGEDLHPFATVPHGFHFHYTDGSAPKTPEREENNPPPPSPPRGGFRIKRRARPRINTTLHLQPPQIVGPSQDIPIPTIETPDMEEPFGPALQQPNAEPIRGLLSPPAVRSLTAPRTPSPQPSGFKDSWNGDCIKTFGESIVRPTSAVSISDSSDESDYGSEDRFSYGGSCTSPESDTTDPFVFPSPKKAHFPGHIHSQEPSPDLSKKAVKSRVTAWTAEMDKHLWTVYMTYLQDPTVTPFKTFPGSPPPLGVCHRVAREAKRTWRSGKAVLGKEDHAANEPKNPHKTRDGTPDTITAEKSGSSTPTSATRQKLQKWPKSGSATRRRLRELCKRKTTITPHYQRLLQSRSPSPFTSSSRSSSKTAKLASPVAPPTSSSSFATRDIQISLTSSTSATMQPQGPLAQLTGPSASTIQPLSDDLFSEASVPWASPAPIPSDVERGANFQETSSDVPQLGSPFGYHTWGPSRSRNHARPNISRATTDDTAASVPCLKSPVHLHGTFPANQKRRAQHQLEDELSPGGSELRRSDLEDLFGGPPLSARRRVRSRGFSLGDAANRARLTSLFNPTTDPTLDSTPEDPDPNVMDAESSTPEQGPQQDSLRRLGSPFAGISGRPSRVRGRHLTSASLSSYMQNEPLSIDQVLN